MKQEQAKSAIRNEDIKWKKEQLVVNDNSKFHFFLFLQKNQQYLLDFKNSGDKWQTVNSMLSGL